MCLLYPEQLEQFDYQQTEVLCLKVTRVAVVQAEGAGEPIKRFGSVIIPHYNPGFGFLPIPIVFLAIPHGGLHSKTPAEVGGQSILECLSYQQAFLSCLFLLYHWHQNQSLLIQEYGEREKTSFYYCLGNHNN